MNLTEPTELSESSYTLSAEALELLKKDRIQTITNKLIYQRPLQQSEREMLEHELETLENIPG